MTREHLLETVWGYDYFGDVRTVDVTIRRLREKIEDAPSRPEYILTRRGVGYFIKEMINQLRYLMTTAEFWFVVILIGFLIALTVLLIENYRDNKQIKQLNQKSMP